MADAYDANVTKFSYENNGRDDEDRAMTIGGLEDLGLIQLRILADGSSALAWMELAHRSLRPPLAVDYVEKVTCTNAQLYINLKEDHPHLRDGSLIDEDACGALLSWFDGDYQDIDDARDEITRYGWTAEEFDTELAKLIRAGWLHRWEDSVAITPEGEDVLSDELGYKPIELADDYDPMEQ
jgi:hypothetical protein